MTALSFDFVIIGSGAGGLSAAITAKLRGLRPLLIEKSDLIGGSSAMSGGVLWLPNNALMQREGIADSREAGLRYLANFVEGSPRWSSLAKREAFVDTAGSLIAMLEGQGMQFRRCAGYSDYYDRLPGGCAAGRSLEAPLFNANRLGSWKERFRPPGVPIPIRTSEGAAMMTLGFSWKGRRTAAKVAARLLWSKLSGRPLYNSGAALQGRLLEIALRLGVEIRTGTAFTGFETQDGRVTGIHVVQAGRAERIDAGHGVLVAAGGFSHNRRMREAWQRHPITDSWTSANPGDTGEAIEAMAALGADLAIMEEAWWTPTFVPPEGPIEVIIPEMVKPRSILVNAAGRRFVNEANSYMEVGRAMYANAAVPAWLILDAAARKRYFFGMRPPGRMPRKLVDKGWIKQDESLAGLARQCGIDPEALEATVARFNGFAERGVDEDFGRGASMFNRYYGDPTHRPNPSLGPIATPPYWAVPLHPGDVGTCGGVVTDAQARVRRTDGSVIEGLYATGNCTAPIAGPWYIGPGQSIASSSIFGHIAANAAAG